MLKEAKNFILNLFYPKYCFLCKRKGSYLCQDCKSTLEISACHQKYSTENLNDLYFTIDYQNPLVKNLIEHFKYEPFIKELADALSSLIITHFQLLDNKPNFFNPVQLPSELYGAGFILIPVPLEKRKLKWRGFNQAEEIGKELAKFFKTPLMNGILMKIKTTLPQVELFGEERKENIKGAFLVGKDENLIKGKKILLVDDVYTTGATMEECARVLKIAGAKEIIGIVIARG